MSFLSDFVGKVTNSLEYLTDGTFTVPENVNFVFITACGGGGSGQASSADAQGSANAAGGGSGRVIVREVVAVTPGTSYSITIGDGGAGVAETTEGNTTFGNPGGSTSFGSIVSVTGGEGGGSNTSATNSQTGGAGAAHGGSTTNQTSSESGEDLQYGSALGTTLATRYSGGASDSAGLGDIQSGGGGAGYFGNGSDAIASGSTDISGNDAPTNSGAGGGGVAVNGNVTSSGAGASGRLIVQW